ncbi:MFS transporter prlG [Paramyrothecium foliicola]|nr:MFS transporter prlG [Paramyrothecium foliicola]
MFVPGAQQLMDDFGIADATVTTMAVSVYVLGLALGPLVFAPLSELYGRLPIYALTSGIFLAFIVGCALATSLAQFIAFRFISGSAAAASLALSGGTLADVIPREKRGKWMAMIILGPMLGPTLGPIAGGFVAQYLGWRWVFRILAIASLVLAVPGICFLRETSPKIILARKAHRRRRLNDTTCQKPRDPIAWKNALHRLARPIRMLFLSPMVLCLSLAVAFSFGLMFLLFASFPTVFQGQYGFSTSTSGLSYIGLGAGMFIGVLVQSRLSDVIAIARASKRGRSMPEDRLPLMAYMAPTIPVGMFWYGWGVEKEIHWIMPIIGTTFVGLGFVFIMMPTMMYLVDAFDSDSAASALAANTVLRSFAGALLPLAAPRMYSELGLGWGNSVLGFLGVAFIPIPWVFLVYGERIRSRSRVEL